MMKLIHLQESYEAPFCNALSLETNSLICDSPSISVGSNPLEEGDEIVFE